MPGGARLACRRQRHQPRRRGICRLRRAGPGKAEACQLDATRGSDAKALVARILAEHGAIDGLVNAAGGARGIGFKKMPFVEMTPDYWTRQLDVNLNSMLNVTHAVLPAMIAAKRGAIVSVAAGRGLKGGAQASIYSAAKAAIIVFSQSIAQEVGPFGVRVNTIAPGNAEARWKKEDLEEARSPLGRATNAEDVGKAVAFLLSDEASHITGACLEFPAARRCIDEETRSFSRLRREKVSREA